MANHKSAQKRARQTEKRTLRNKAVRTRIKTTVREFREATAGGDKATTNEAFEQAKKSIDKAASKGVLHKRTAARRISRLAKAVNKANA